MISTYIIWNQTSSDKTSLKYYKLQRLKTKELYIDLQNLFQLKQQQELNTPSLAKLPFDVPKITKFLQMLMLIC